jgi:hypothetical protein
MSNEVTVGDLRRQLQAYSDDDKLTFAGGLTFYRVRAWGDNEASIEFNEPEGYLSNEFKKKNPSVKVVFISTDNVEWNESGVIGGPIDVSVR